MQEGILRNFSTDVWSKIISAMFQYNQYSLSTLFNNTSEKEVNTRKPNIRTVSILTIENSERGTVRFAT